MNIAESRVDQRQRSVLQIPHGALGAFLLPTPELIFEQISKLLKRNGGFGVFLDLDDASFVSEPYLRNRLERTFREQGAIVPHVPIDEVIAAGGRHFQVHQYQNAVEELNAMEPSSPKKKFGDYYAAVATNEGLHARMRPVTGVIKFQKQLEQMGFTTCGYPTARPEKIIPISAAALHYFHFTEAPVIDVAADLKDPSDAKVAFMQRVFAQQPDTKLVLFFDDHVQTAIKLQEAFPGKVVSLVPIVPRNKHQIPDLEKHDIIHGSFEELIHRLDVRGIRSNH